MSTQIDDPGFGVRGLGRGRILRKDGTSNVRRIGAGVDMRDMYHAALNASWPTYFLWTTLIYIGFVALFAAVYVAVGIDGVKGARVGSLSLVLQDAFFFSAQTLTTVGYGNLAPGSAIIGIIATFEAMAGLVLFGMFTGLAFGRFARVTPRITFSSHALIAPFKAGINALMIRMVNERDGMIMDAHASVILAYDSSPDQLAKGEGRRRFFRLDLVVSTITSMTMNWTIVHEITADSPFSELSLEELRQRHAELVVIFEAFDDSVGQKFYARTSYRASEILAGRRFVMMYRETESGVVELDLRKISDTESAELYTSL